MEGHSLLQGGLPDRGGKPRSPALWADSLPSEPPGKPIKTLGYAKMSLSDFTLTKQQGEGHSAEKPSSHPALSSRDWG